MHHYIVSVHCLTLRGPQNRPTIQGIKGPSGMFGSLGWITRSSPSRMEGRLFPDSSLRDRKAVSKPTKIREKFQGSDSKIGFRALLSRMPSSKNSSIGSELNG
ncbi:hypothetical protein NPIL_133761 [Nephila pilipes]|uniref:Uncharacterized protein n=1 Tax=Nephila pilipes TaxID=299642 RepID=A0A8X6QPI6_NEPPI|nr:hypothetical protein NPIL_133761 [Nephila pilipes]